ncbi:hypothetical protein [uncultured Roseobacter sp.]|uniref:hypothetical protein n=1 Tax=uncultured Roseobacter sp. TaxID=114847 RepID=UPI002623A9F0|nr:hypothetical protein [uncultured Roseobacter sp.]
MGFNPDTLKLAAIIGVALLVKHLMTEVIPPEDETDAQRRARKRKTVGGLLAGGLFAYAGHVPFMEFFSINPETGTWMSAVFLAFAGEHVARELMRPQFISKILEKRFGGGR